MKANEMMDSMKPIFELKLSWSEEKEAVMMAIRMSKTAGQEVYQKGTTHANQQITAKIMQIMAMVMATEETHELQKYVTDYVLRNVRPEDMFGEEFGPPIH